MEVFNRRRVFVAGATGYLGQALILRLLHRGHEVRGLCRKGSEGKLPQGCGVVLGDALDAASYAQQVPPADTFVHLVGVSHPSPWKAEQFQAVDLCSIEASIRAARQARVPHFIYVSVAHPAPVMKSYVAVRQQCEELLQSSGLRVTVLRPWYVLGPGHRWPYALVPLYWLAGRFPASREGAQRLGLLTRAEMTAALVRAVEHPEDSPPVMGVSEIRSLARREARAFAR